MKLNFGRRLVLFLHWLLSLIVFALVVLWSVSEQTLWKLTAAISGVIGAEAGGVACIALGALYALLSVLSVIFILSQDKKRAERGFITVDSSEAGRTRIAVGAVEQMIRQAVRSVDGIADMKSVITNNEDAISISASVSIMNGAHVPTVTMNIQRAIRSYIELNCGVAVREVSVSVHSLLDAEENGKQGRRKLGSAAAYKPAPVAAPAEMESVAAEVVSSERIPLETAIESCASEEAAPMEEEVIQEMAEQESAETQEIDENEATASE